MEEEKSFICCICGKTIVGEWGNNPYPVKKDGQCCDKCNNLVIMTRLTNRIMKEKENG